MITMDTMDAMNTTMVEMIVAMDEKGGIGINNSLPPWKIKEDLFFFRTMTTGNTVIMGMNTFLSIPSHTRPLPDRFNIVITREPTKYAKYYPDVYFTESTKIESMLNIIPLLFRKKIIVIGGAQIYDIFSKYYTAVYVTHINGNYGCNVKLDLDKYVGKCDKRTELVEKSNFKIVKYEL